MRVGYCQSEVVFGEPGRNLDRTAEILGAAAFDLVVLPECFATGYLFESRAQALSLAEAVPGGRTTSLLADLARARQGWIVAGVVEREGDHLFNTAVVVGPRGYAGKHRKVHLPTLERALFTAGEPGAGLFEADGVRLGLVVCYEAWFPERCRALALAGADILCHPANFGGDMSLDVIRTRALENMVYTVTANRVGAEGMAVFRGESRIVDPEGAILLQAGAEPALGMVDIDPLRARIKRSRMCDDLGRELAHYR